MQHEVLEGEQAAVYAPEQTLDIQVNCRGEADGLKEPVPYALVVTLEIQPNIQVPLYDEVRARIQPRVQVGVVAP